MHPTIACGATISPIVLVQLIALEERMRRARGRKWIDQLTVVDLVMDALGVEDGQIQTVDVTPNLFIPFCLIC